MQDNTQRFSDKVSNYIKYRPGYPQEIISFLEQTTRLNSDAKIVDIGSGTGKLTQIFIDASYPITGVEPNTEMRLAAENIFKNNSLFTSVNGTAEVTTLPDDSCTHIVVGQAFHWFDAVTSKVEFQRILKNEGWVILIWNERDIKTSFLADYEVFLHNHAVNYSKVVHRNIDDESFKNFFAPFEYQFKSIYSYQLYDFEGILGRYLSSSYSFKENDSEFQSAKEALKVLFDKHQKDGQIVMEYQTKIYFGQLQ